MAIKTYVIFSILFLAVLSTSAQVVEKERMGKLKWLFGRWARTNAPPGQTGMESWTKTSRDKFIGMGLTLKGRDTVFTENLQIMARKDGVYYVAEVRENKGPVSFRLIDITATGFVCENVEHDFPKRIAYQLTGNLLTVVISGNGRSSSFHFSKEQ